MKVLVVLVMVGAALSFPEESGSEVRNEEPCLKHGGVCGLESACPVDSRMASGLCPDQQSGGVECCQTIPSNIKECGKRGGDCVPEESCGRAPRESEGQCPAGEVCCIFIN